MIWDYLQNNSDARDALESISKWRFEYERVNQSVDKVSQILEVIVEKDLIIKFKNSNGSLIIRLKKVNYFKK